MKFPDKCQACTKFELAMVVLGCQNSYHEEQMWGEGSDTHGLNGMDCRDPRRHRAHRFPGELSNLGAEAKKAGLGLTLDVKSARKTQGRIHEGSMSNLEMTGQGVQAGYEEARDSGEGEQRRKKFLHR